GAQHSDAPYAEVIHGGGVKVVVPTTPDDAKGLIKSAIRDPNPVIVMLPMALGSTSGDVPGGDELVSVRPLALGDASGEVPEGEHLVPLGRGRVVREGADVTVVAIGAMVRRAVEAAEELAGEGVAVEVIDPRTLHPFDYALVLASVRKTGRLIC